MADEQATAQSPLNDEQPEELHVEIPEQPQPAKLEAYTLQRFLPSGEGQGKWTVADTMTDVAEVFSDVQAHGCEWTEENKIVLPPGEGSSIAVTLKLL